MKKFLAGLLFVYSVLANEHVFAGNFNVVFINPGHPVADSTGTFWSSVNRFMQAAANDLDIELVSLYAERDHILMKQLAQTVNSHSPDYVIIVNEKGVGKELVKAIAPYKLPIFTLLNGFSQQHNEVKADFLSSITSEVTLSIMYLFCFQSLPQPFTILCNNNTYTIDKCVLYSHN